jgi:hypothetical protein
MYVGSTTTNGSGNFSFSITGVTFTNIFSCQATAILAGGTVNSAPFVSLQTVSTTTITGIIMSGQGILIGGNSLKTVGSGITVYIR